MKQRKKIIKRFEKNIKGITLIALVVTIIVLLILAAVAINLTIGSNGIFTRAENAVDKYEEASVNEQKQLNNVANYLDNMTKEETVIEAYKSGKIKMGDYVNYQNPISGEYTSAKEKNGVADQKYTVDSSTQWRVLGLSEDGKHLLLVAADPIKRGEISNPNTENGLDIETITKMKEKYYFYMYGAEGAYYATDNNEGEGELDKISAIYKNDIAEEARSMTTEDINNLLNLTVKYENPNAGVYKKEDISYAKNFDEWGILGKSYTYKEGDETPGSELGIEKVIIGHEEKGSAYRYKYGERYASAPRPNIEIGIDLEMYELLFNGTEGSRNKIYYLASSSVGAIPDRGVVFGTGLVGMGKVSCLELLFDSEGNKYKVYGGVRPVVSLKPEVLVSQLKVISGSRGDNWGPVRDPF